MQALTDESLSQLLEELREGLRILYGERLRGLFLFGSYARGDADGESDVDVLIVLDRVSSYGREVDPVGPLISQLSLEYGVSVIPVFAGETEWREGSGFFLASVRQEARWLLEAFSKDLSGDYGAEIELTSEEVEQTIDRADHFISRASDYLSSST